MERKDRLLKSLHFAPTAFSQDAVLASLNSFSAWKTATIFILQAFQWPFHDSIGSFNPYISIFRTEEEAQPKESCSSRWDSISVIDCSCKCSERVHALPPLSTYSSISLLVPVPLLHRFHRDWTEKFHTWCARVSNIRTECTQMKINAHLEDKNRND